jgi:hypothetical protein
VKREARSTSKQLYVVHHLLSAVSKLEASSAAMEVALAKQRISNIPSKVAWRRKRVMSLYKAGKSRKQS